MKISVAKKVENLTDWFYRRNNRPLLGFYLDSQYPLHRYRGSKRNLPNGVVEPKDIVVKDYLEDCDRLYELYEEAGGDLIWSAAPFFGLPWVEASLGCKVVANHKAGSTRAEAPKNFENEPYIPDFREDNPWVRKLDEFIFELNKHSKGRYPVGVTLMRGVSDLLSALYGGERFLYRMLDSPDEVRELAKKLAKYWIAFGKHMMDGLQLFHGGTGAFFYSVWCPGSTIWMQEDASALLSPDIYDRFIHPHNVEIIKQFENTVIHFHPSRFMPLNRLIESGIGVIEIHIDSSGPRATELYQQYMKVLKVKPLIIWGNLTPDDLDFIMNNLPYKGLAVNMVVSSTEEAKKIWGKTIGRYYE